MTVTDIDIVDGDWKEHDRWVKDGHDLNKGAGGSYLYTAWEKDGKAGPITEIRVIEDKQETPAGFTKIDRDLNEGTDPHGKSLYLCYSRTAANKPIQELTVTISGDKYAPPPAGFERYDANLNEGAGNDFVYLCLRR
ncbi:hypothetical protein ACIQF6_19930 [Kitasatospora sp. NPDC092948]|uniref:hypothetical protein n=1 Tax=Kitasatospora sp. NPDC092948 TaxID=3364088 RepID=UPI0037F1EEFB